MIIPITIPRPNQFSPKLPSQLAQLGNNEFFLIELQGTLDVEGTETTPKDGQLIGNLNTTDMNKPTLTIGHHLLEGKVVNLPKPLGVLHKQGRSSSSGNETTGSSTQETEASTTWGVVAVVKKKLMFSKRPMPIAAKPASAARKA
ncbi:Ctf8-domain-containing protein [Scleroderma yunnanense]